MKNTILQDGRARTMINLATGVLVLLFNAGIQFILSPYIVRTLGEAANGYVQLANNFVTYASLITIAFNSMASRHISIFYHQDNTKDVDVFYSTIVVCNLVITLIFTLIGAIIVLNLDSIIQIEDISIVDTKVLFVLVFITFIFNLFISVFSISLYTNNALYIYNGVQFLRVLLNAIFLLVTFVMYVSKITYVGYAGCFSTFIALLVSFAFHKNIFKKVSFKLTNFRWKALKKMFTSGIWNTVNQAGNLLMTETDLLLANLFIGPKEMGVLSIAKTFPLLISNLSATINSNFLPALTIAWAKKDFNTIKKSLKRNMAISNIVLSVPISVFCTFGVYFYKLWMPSMDAKELTLVSFLAFMAYIPWSGPQTLFNVYTMTDNLKVNAISFVTCGFINIITVYILLNETNLGIIAIASVSSILSILRNLIISAPYTAHLLGLKWFAFYKDVVMSFLINALNFGVSYCIGRIIQPQSWLTLIFTIFIVVVVIVIADLSLLLKKSDYIYIKRKMEKLLK